VVEVVLEKGFDDPQLIFESMNATGMDLSQADLIRNYMLMGLDLPIQTDIYQRYWYPMEVKFGDDSGARFNNFMRDYLSVRTGKIPTIDKVYEEFKKLVVGSTPRMEMSDLAQDIAKLGGYYVNIVLCHEPATLLLKSFQKLAALQVEVATPFLLRVYEDYSAGLLNEKEFAQIVDRVESYIFRRSVCGIPTNSHNKTFVTLYKSVRKGSYVESVDAAFQLMENYRRFPSDIEFEQALKTRDVYNSRIRRPLLDRLENNESKELVNVDACTIEHVMPQNDKLRDEWKEMLGENWKEIQETYLHTLGNLTLTGYNPELSDRPYSEKKSMEGGFDSSPLKLNAFLKRTAVWNEEKTQERAVELAQQATKIWSLPCLTSGALDKYRSQEATSSNQYSLDNYEFLKGDQLNIFNALRLRILNLDSGIKEVLTKHYIAFKADNNFVGVEAQKERLVVTLAAAKDSISDPLNKAEDIAGVGNLFNGKTRLYASGMEDVDYAMQLISEAYRLQDQEAE
jgi:predicted transport protein